MKKTHIGISIMFATLLSIGLTSTVLAYNPIQSQLDFGENNTDVTNLQNFFKDNSAIYPEGLVTGYFGSLTRSGVQRFQAENEIVNSGTPGTTGFGRVGPSTQSKINTLIASGGWTISDVSGPAIFSVAKATTNTSATFTWNTNELASAKIFYNTSPVTMNEGDINSIGFGSTNGSTAVNDNLARTNQQVMISGLHPNTQYYYIIVATDLKGNVSVWNPNTTFVTNQ